jgi:ATP-dependent DNA helicase DinG
MSALSWPPPSDFGLPSELFPAWRPGQPEAISAVIDAPTRFSGLVLPTGFGKSLVYMGTHAITQWTTVVLTSTKALQSQLARDFGDLPSMTRVQGQSNYRCTALDPGGELYASFGSDKPTTVEHGPCHLGVVCSKLIVGCGYFDDVKAAQSSRIVITNYAWWLTLRTNPKVVLRPDLLVLDEAHDAPDALADAIGATLHADQIQSVFHERLPKADALDADVWVQWARERGNRVAKWLDGTHPRTPDAVRAVRRAQHVHRGLQRIAAIDPALLLKRDEPGGVRFDVVWAAPLAESWLFRHVPRVALTSATMTRHTADLLGIPESDITMYEAGDGFPLKRRPVYVTPAKREPWGEALRVDHRMTTRDVTSWVEHIDQLIDARLDRRGIIHTVSYERRDLLVARSRHAARMVTHSRHDTADQIATFKTKPGAVLVSPSVTTGYDFPFADCEYQIVCKIPFPDSRDPITAARTLVDTRYPAHLAMQALVQMVGRGMRAPTDQCETFIVDAHAHWFLSKHADLAPKWFRRAVRRLEPGTVPTPPRPLGRHVT